MKQHEVLAAIDTNSAAGRQVLSGIFDFIDSGHPWNLSILSSRDELTPARIRQAEASGVHGLIVSFLGTCKAYLAATRLPIAFFGSQNAEMERMRQDRTVFIWNDNFSLGKSGGEYLSSLGKFQSYAYVHTRLNGNHSEKRLAGYRSAIRAATKLPVRSFDSPKAEGTPAELKTLADWLSTLPKPCAVLAATDKRAINVLNAAKAASISIPKQLSLVGIDNNELLVAHSNPPVTSILPGHFEMGQRAARELERLMATRRTLKNRSFIIPPTRIIIRESTTFLKLSETLVDRIRRFIAEHAAEPELSVKDILSHLRCSRTLADRRYHQATGLTLRAALEDERLKKAKSLLKATRRSAATIAAQCGFRSASHFNHVFRRVTGQTPCGWRRAATDSGRGTVDIHKTPH